MSASLPLSYPDLVCTDDLDPFASETSSDLQTLEQDVLHVLDEAMGSNPDDPERGVGIYNIIGGTVDQLQQMAATIDTQLEKDDRIDSSTTTIADVSTTDEQAGAYYLISIALIVDGSVLNLSYDLTPSGLQVSQ